MLRFGERLNPNWDTLAAHGYLSELGIPSAKKVGKLSVGQQAQVAMAMCLAKQPALLLLDEPLAALDPVAREGLMHLLLGSVADGQTTVLLSSHAIADLATVCDYIIILSASRVLIADDLDYVLASHRLLLGSSEGALDAPSGVVVVARTCSERQIELLVRVEQPVDSPSWQVVEPTLEEIVLAYLREQSTGIPPDIGASESVEGQQR
jgi:ABC-2 type transport system ATP-binding protein